jgi:hypothetical protein
MPPADEVVFASITAGSITGSAIPPAKADDAATVRAAASASFFIVTSSFRTPSNFSEDDNAHPRLYLMGFSNQFGEKNAIWVVLLSTVSLKFRQFGNTMTSTWAAAV